MHLGNSALQQKLPKAPAFKCGNCGALIKAVKADSTSRLANNIVANCTASCNACGASHVGTRTMTFRQGHLRFLGQSWALGERAKAEPDEPDPATIAAAIAVGKRRLVIGASALAGLAATLGLVYVLGH